MNAKKNTRLILFILSFLISACQNSSKTPTIVLSPTTPQLMQHCVWPTSPATKINYPGTLLFTYLPPDLEKKFGLWALQSNSTNPFLVDSGIPFPGRLTRSPKGDQILYRKSNTFEDFSANRIDRKLVLLEPGSRKFIDITQPEKLPTGLMWLNSGEISWEADPYNEVKGYIKFNLTTGALKTFSPSWEYLWRDQQPRNLLYSPNGNATLLTYVDKELENYFLLYWDLEKDKELWRLPMSWVTANGYQWSSSGQEIAYIDTPFSTRESARNKQELFIIDLLGKKRRVTNYLATAPYTRVSSDEISWSPNDRYVAHWVVKSYSINDHLAPVSESATLHLFDATLNQSIDLCLPSKEASVGSIHWSPNSQFLVVTMNTGILVIDLNSYQSMLIQRDTLTIEAWTLP